MSKDQLKQQAAEAALEYVKFDTIVGVGTGSTVNHFIQALASIRHKIRGCVSSSEATTEQLHQLGFTVYSMNEVIDIDVYIDGADEIDTNLNMIKGGGGALTREKIVSSLAKQFVCIADESKAVTTLGEFPLPIEVIPMARSHIARQLVRKYQAEPVYRQDVITDNGNIILDVYGLNIENPMELEQQLNNMPGVVTNGIFAMQSADVFLKATRNQGVVKVVKS